jgi:hypothetical protein
MLGFLVLEPLPARANKWILHCSINRNDKVNFQEVCVVNKRPISVALEAAALQTPSRVPRQINAARAGNLITGWRAGGFIGCVIYLATEQRQKAPPAQEHTMQVFAGGGGRLQRVHAMRAQHKIFCSQAHKGKKIRRRRYYQTTLMKMPQLSDYVSIAAVCMAAVEGP